MDLVILLFTLIVILLAILASTGRIKNGLGIAFIIITVFCALRYDFGNDYMNYYNQYYQIWGKVSLTTFWQDNELIKEPGWAFLCIITQPIGFYGLIAITSIFTSAVYYRLIRKYVPVKLYWLAMTVYILNPYLFWIELAMIRQALALTIFFAVSPFIIKKKVLIGALAVAVAYTIHRSAIILLPFIFIGYFPIKKGKYVAVELVAILALLSTSLLVLMDKIMPLLIGLSSVESYLMSYGTTDEFEGAGSLGVGGIILFIPFVVFLYYFWKSKATNTNVEYLVLLSSVNYLMTPLALLNGILGRLAYYFHVFCIVSIPITFAILNKRTRYLLLIVYLSMTLFQYYLFFNDPGWQKFHTYKTILFN